MEHQELGLVGVVVSGRGGQPVVFPLLPVHEDVVPVRVHCQHAQVHRLQHGIEEFFLPRALFEGEPQLSVLLFEVPLLPDHAERQHAHGYADAQHHHRKQQGTCQILARDVAANEQRHPDDAQGSEEGDQQ
ncbi:hypothetical protein D9M72_600050 [compost metagenome]